MNTRAPRMRVFGTPLAALGLRNREADDLMTTMAQAGASLLDPWPEFCDDTACSALAGGFAGYFDNNHITNTNARRVRGVFAPVFAASGAP